MVIVIHNYNRIAYVPIDLPFVKVDLDLVNLVIDNLSPGHHDGIWDTLPLLGRVPNQRAFKDSAEFEVAWEKRYDKDGEVLLNESVYDILKPIFDQFEKLPLYVTHAQILRATRDVPKHHDMKHVKGKFINDRPDITYDPNGFKIMLSHVDTESFFVSETFDSDKVYIKLPSSTNTFAINEKIFPHGSDYIKDKCVVSIFGLVKENEMDSLLERSENKFKEYVIRF